MTRKIRRGVFDTNSSSVHSLSMTRNDKSHLIWDVLRGIGEHNNGVIKVGVTPIDKIRDLIFKSVLYISELPIQVSLDLLFYSYFSECDMIVDAFEKVSDFVSIFKKHGIIIEANINEISASYNEMVWVFTDELKITELLGEACSIEEGIEQMLSSDRCVYTCYNDENWCGCPEEIEEVYDHFSKIPKDKKITATIRC